MRVCLKIGVGTHGGLKDIVILREDLMTDERADYHNTGAYVFVTIVSDM